MERHLVLLTFFLCSVAVVCGAENYSDYGGYRIPNLYSPSLYNIQLTVPADVFSGNSTTFTGIVTITLQVTEATDQIQIHAPLNIFSVSLTAGASVALPTINNLTYNASTSILTIPFTSALPIQTDLNLTIYYEGSINITSMKGLYRSNYEDVNGTEYLLATQFESTSAREAFPCFDEPSLKAQFDISITYPQGFNAISNTPQISRITTK